MKRYIRTKDGKIFDICRDYIYDKYDYYRAIKDCYEILKEADTIEELIEVGDLVFDDEEDSSFCFIVNRIYKKYGVICFEGEFKCSRYADMITEFYTKKGNDYILVAKKEKGEWRVI